MTVKHIGLLFCASAFCLGGLFRGVYLKKIYKEVLFFRELVIYLKDQICLMHTELPQCFRDYTSAGHRVFLDECIKGSYETAVETLSVDKKFSALFLEFLNGLGSHPSKSEEEYINRFLMLLQGEAEAMATKTEGKIKSAQVLGICIGAVLLLLFW